nr:nucleotidyltransferase domain-containing protein [Microlunatus antarcticus]
MSRLVAAARSDQLVVGAALLGSAARGEEDRWSDIDLALRLAPGADVVQTADRWTGRVAETELVVDHLDLRASGALYRVLLLGSTLQVDLSFWPHDQTLAFGAPVEVLFGELPVEVLFGELPVEVSAVGSTEVDGDAMAAFRMGWLYALHARSALGRGRVWQALWMLNSLRDVVVGLYCRRLGLPVGEGRGVDRLPSELLPALAASLPVGVEARSLQRSFKELIGLLLAEAERQHLPGSLDLTRVISRLARVEPST